VQPATKLGRERDLGWPVFVWESEQMIKEVKIVKRILTVLMVALVMAALVVATAAPAFALKKVGPDSQFHLQQNGHHSPPFNGGDRHSPPPND
jgi:hypothetical protein